MMLSRTGRRVAALVTAAMVGTALVPASGVVGAEAKDSRTTDEKWVDAVRTPTLDWYSCYGGSAQCATVDVPLDYDKPKGPTTELALLKIPADKPKQKIGTLFVNPGGPGGSATDFASYASEVFSAKVTERFDVVGIDPRGIGYSENVRCFANEGRQSEAMKGYASAFPMGDQQEKAWLTSDRAVGKACAGTPLARSASTSDVARDMELMRRAVGDKKLTYFGFSYGTYLGQVYANMFPGRFRAVAVDGVLDPVAWAGDKSNRAKPLEARLNSSGGAYKALIKILKECDKAGGARCRFAPGDPVANLDTLMKRLRDQPVDVPDPDGGSASVTYSDVVATLLGMLYTPTGYADIAEFLSDLWIVTEPPATTARSADPKRAEAAKAVADSVAENGRDRPTRGFPYQNGLEAFASVTCTDSTETTKRANYPAYAAQQDEKAPYFGRAWMWSTSICAGNSWTINESDVYTGPFNTQTAAPVLFIGNYWDPATNYDGARSAAKRMPNAALLSSDSYGHTAYGTSACATNAIDGYLVTGKAPKAGTVCTGDVQPFKDNAPEDVAAAKKRARMMAAASTSAEGDR